MPLAILAAAAFVLVSLFLGALGGALGATFSNGPGEGLMCQTTPGKAAAQIPANYLAAYAKAGAEYGISWNVLAAVGAVESDHGRGRGSGIRSGRNSAGAAGPMQFISGTWDGYGVDGNHDGKKDVYDPADAIPAGARLLKANGAPEHMERALFAYNHSDIYVKKVLAQAAAYGKDAGAASCPVVPVAASGRAAVAMRAALRYLGTPYSWGGGGSDGPTSGIAQGAGIVGFDCSGLTLYAWHQAGVSIPRTSQDQWATLPHVPAGREAPGDLVFFQGALGTMSQPGHVGLVLGGGKMIEAPHTGARVRISSIRTRSDLVGYARPGTGPYTA
ncbi:C40 family peptidase [Actinomadura barringtoniae]|uniref:C40 family peptidase n=1 Tax=Actinomadura barringtoniae TaxID=1427535 RepID=A0A939PQG9_9ACTN|nr:NlpC/P60 family protein [Actinomadura barringtoniae]MBO2454353.1 C40 family peptidase [Actinomadura barringtoniae]